MDKYYKYSLIINFSRANSGFCFTLFRKEVETEKTAMVIIDGFFGTGANKNHGIIGFAGTNGAGLYFEDGKYVDSIHGLRISNGKIMAMAEYLKECALKYPICDDDWFYGILHDFNIMRYDQGIDF